jgi:hypothetical protein
MVDVRIDERPSGRSSVQPGVVEHHVSQVDRDLARRRRARRGVFGCERRREAQFAGGVGVEVGIDVAELHIGKIDDRVALSEKDRPQRRDERNVHAGAIDAKDLRPARIRDANARAVDTRESDVVDALDGNVASKRRPKNAVDLVHHDTANRPEPQGDECEEGDADREEPDCAHSGSKQAPHALARPAASSLPSVHQ